MREEEREGGDEEREGGDGVVMYVRIHVHRALLNKKNGKKGTEKKKTRK